MCRVEAELCIYRIALNVCSLFTTLYYTTIYDLFYIRNVTESGAASE